MNLKQSLLTAGLILAAGTAIAMTEPPAHDEHGDGHTTAAQPAKAAPKAATGAKAEPKTDAKPFSREQASNKAEPKTDAGKKTSESAETAPDAAAALQMLREGNQRWVANHTDAPSTDPSRRKEVAENGQHPFVTVVTCADSRLPVERVFDRGVGEVFVVRVAGNVAGDSETGTVEYGVGHLHTPLLVVMGHTKCGAVAAAASGAKVHGHVAGLLARVQPAVERTQKQNPELTGDALVAAAVKENVWQTVFDMLKQSDDLRSAVQNGQVKVVGAVCDVSTGKVEFMGEHPWQAELMAALNAAPQQQTAEAHEAPAGHDGH